MRSHPELSDSYFDIVAEKCFQQSELYSALADFHDSIRRKPSPPPPDGFDDLTADEQHQVMKLLQRDLFAITSHILRFRGESDRLFYEAQMHSDHAKAIRQRRRARGAISIVNADHDELRPIAVARVVELIASGEVTSKRQAIKQASHDTGYSQSALWKHTPKISEMRSDR